MNIELKSFMIQLRKEEKVFINKHKIALLCLRQPASMNYLRGTNLRLRSIKRIFLLLMQCDFHWEDIKNEF